jgi:hypothetical protein
VRLRLGVPVSLLQRGVWRRSPAAATLFKQLFPCDTELGTQHGILVLVCCPVMASMFVWVCLS